MNKRKAFLLFILLIGVLVLAACGSSDSATGGTEKSVSAGEKIVRQSCATCHGTDLKGASATGLYGLDLTKEEIIDVVANGKPGMPGGLAKGNEEAVAEYLLTLK